jgi:hypothetical protein
MQWSESLAQHRSEGIYTEAHKEEFTFLAGNSV